MDMLSNITLSKTAAVLLLVAVIAALDLIARATREKSRMTFGIILGTVMAFGLMAASRVLFGDAVAKQGVPIALGVFLLVVAWRLLFGHWEARTKATVLGTFVFWLAVSALWKETPADRLAHGIAIAIGLVPAVVWCWLFLPYHRERTSVVLTMFFAGMLATIPILFYDALVRNGAELNFFLFKVTPQSFSSSARLFVTGHWQGISPLQSSLLSMFLSFLLVGVIEEGSKFWVLRRAGTPYIASIDDALQLSIITAIGFAFAENITNTGYFLSFVREYLLNPETRNIFAFVGNVAGRSVLTTMVHVVSTGILGYQLGVGMFAGSVLQEQQQKGVRYRVLEELHDLFGIPKRDLFRRMRLLTGFLAAIVLHALSNFLVSLPDALPGNPRTVGDLLGSATGSPLHFVALLLFPTLFYVVGGFTFLTALFFRKENMKVRGHLVETETFVSEEPQR